MAKRVDSRSATIELSVKPSCALLAAAVTTVSPTCRAVPARAGDDAPWRTTETCPAATSTRPMACAVASSAAAARRKKIVALRRFFMDSSPELVAQLEREERALVFVEVYVGAVV